MTRNLSSVHIVGTRGYPSFYGGFETAVRRLAPFLADRGWDVTVMGRPGAHMRPAEADVRIHIKTTKGIDSKSLSAVTYGFTSMLRTAIDRPDVALIMNVANGLWLPFLKIARVRTIVNVDGIEWERAKWGSVARTVFRIGAWLTARLADQLICDAEAIAARWRDEYGRASHVIAYGGEVYEALPPQPGLEGEKYVLIVARLVPENTIDEFLDAVPIIARHLKVIIVGSSGYGGEIEERLSLLVSKEPNVTWLGHVSNDRVLASLWQHCSAYFHGHSVGGTNPALVQAMACGAPTVARDTVFNHEVLEDAGIFVAPDSGLIASALIDLAQTPHLQHQLSTRAIARATQNYSWELICGRYDDSLKSISRNAQTAVAK